MGARAVRSVARRREELKSFPSHDLGTNRPPADAAATATAKYFSVEVTLLVCVLGIFSCFLSTGMLQEVIVSYRSKDGRRFSSTLFLLWVPCAVAAAFAYLAMQLNGRSAGKIPQQLFGTAAFGYTGAMVLSMESLKYVNFPTKVLGKSCKLIPVMLFGVIFAKKRYSWRNYLCVGLITLGISTFSFFDPSRSHWQDTENSAFGRYMLVASLLLDGVTTSAQERIKSVCKPTVHEMMFFMNVWAVSILSVAALASGQWSEGMAFCSENPLVMCYVLGLSLASTLGQNFIYLTVTSFSPLVCSTISTTRKFFTIVFSVVMFGHPIAVHQWGGVAMVFAGIGFEVKGKYDRRLRDQSADRKKGKDHLVYKV